MRLTLACKLGLIQQQRTCLEILLSRFCFCPRDHHWWVSESRHLHNLQIPLARASFPHLHLTICSIDGFMSCSQSWKLFELLIFSYECSERGGASGGKTRDIPGQGTNIMLYWLTMKNLQPPSDKKKKEEMLRKREQRMMQAMAERFVIIIFILWRLNICWLLPIYTEYNVHTLLITCIAVQFASWKY